MEKPLFLYLEIAINKNKCNRCCNNSQYRFPILIVRIKSFQAEYTAQKMKFSIKDFFSKYDQIRSFLWIWSHLLKKSLVKNFIFYAVIACSMFFSWNFGELLGRAKIYTNQIGFYNSIKFLLKLRLKLVMSKKLLSD